MGNEDPLLLSQEELMNTEKYFVTPVGSQLTSEEKKKQAAKVKRQRLREDAKNRKAAKLTAEKKERTGLGQLTRI